MGSAGYGYTAISAALDLDVLSHFRLQDLFPISSDVVSQQQSVVALYAIYLIGLALAFNAGTNGGYRSLIYVLSLVVLQTHSLIQVFILEFPRLSIKHRVLQLWESNSSSQSHR